MKVVDITYFVHSTSVYNEKELMAGWIDVELSELGKKQSLELRELTKHMNFDVVFSSDLKRAYDTAKTAFGNRFKIIVDKRLRECNYGDIGGTSSETMSSLGSLKFIDKPFPNGESYKDVQKRIGSFLKDLLQNYAGKHIAIVAHQAPQLSLEVITKGKTWEQAIKEDWRVKKAWQPGWNYKLEDKNIGKMKLIIFDLDQTLVDFLSTHNKATEEIFKKYFNVKAKLTEIDFAGRSLKDTFIELSKLKNVQKDKTENNMKKLLIEYEKYFIKNFPKNPSKHVLPGCKKLLSKLYRKNIVVLYTGDSKKIIKKVLTETGLKKYFKFYLSGTEVKTRSEMIGLAIKKSERLTGGKFRNKDIVVIGDSIRDIECGKKFNALTIAVATGFHSKKQLLELKPDYLFNNMKNYNKILKAIE